MTITIPIHSNGKDYAVVDKFPDHCPICHAGIEPIKQGSLHHNSGSRTLEIVFRCPREKCQSLFISRYGTFGMSSQLFYRGSYPSVPNDADFSEEIGKISPQFCAIANQAHNAEEQGWKLIAGPGYRKALEFLIKDYLSLTQSKQMDTIKATQLGTCINKFVTDDRVKAMAARAAWLGNDETHYARKWADNDLEDLKKLIVLTVHWIEMEAMTNDFIKNMPDPKSGC